MGDGRGVTGQDAAAGGVDRCARHTGVPSRRERQAGRPGPSGARRQPGLVWAVAQQAIVVATAS
jgi:hypothetical protein